MVHIQYFTADDDRVYRFIDGRQNHSIKCQPRDIALVDEVDQDTDENRAIRYAICVDIRRGQGFNEVGIAKGMLWT